MGSGISGKVGHLRKHGFVFSVEGLRCDALILVAVVYRTPATITVEPEYGGYSIRRNRERPGCHDRPRIEVFDPNCTALLLAPIIYGRGRWVSVNVEGGFDSATNDAYVRRAQNEKSSITRLLLWRGYLDQHG
jgi:hypothetical protein